MFNQCQERRFCLIARRIFREYFGLGLVVLLGLASPSQANRLDDCWNELAELAKNSPAGLIPLTQIHALNHKYAGEVSGGKKRLLAVEIFRTLSMECEHCGLPNLIRRRKEDAKVENPMQPCVGCSQPFSIKGIASDIVIAGVKHADFEGITVGFDGKTTKRGLPLHCPFCDQISEAWTDPKKPEDERKSCPNCGSPRSEMVQKAIKTDLRPGQGLIVELDENMPNGLSVGQAPKYNSNQTNHEQQGKPKRHWKRWAGLALASVATTAGIGAWALSDPDPEAEELEELDTTIEEMFWTERVTVLKRVGESDEFELVFDSGLKTGEGPDSYRQTPIPAKFTKDYYTYRPNRTSSFRVKTALDAIPREVKRNEFENWNVGEEVIAISTESGAVKELGKK